MLPLPLHFTNIEKKRNPLTLTNYILPISNIFFNQFFPKIVEGETFDIRKKIP